MGKFFEALKRGEALKPGPSNVRLHRGDWQLLLRHDQDSGRLNLADPAIARQADSLQRLAHQGLIEADGRLTAQGLRACAHLGAQAPQPSNGLGSLVTAAAEIETIDLDQHRLPEGAVGGNGSGRLAPSAPEVGTVAPPNPAPAPQPLESHRRSPAPGETDRLHPDLVVFAKPRSYEAEQFKILRAAILFPEKGPIPRVVVVTSAEPGEGKSFVAANLAASMAMSLDRHVFLVDGDLRRPSIHRLFGRPLGPGLTEHLTAFQDLSTVVQPAPLPSLYLVTAGRCPDNPSEVLSSERMAGFLQAVTAQHPDRLVVIDSPPALVAAESMVLAGFADGIILVVKKNGPRREEVHELVRKLGRQKILGIVGNFEAKITSGYYYKMKKYGRYYGKG